MDKIYINNLEFIAYHGVFPEEKKLGQKFLVSAEMTTSTREAGKTGNLKKSTHYGLVANDIGEIFTGKSIDLIETCAEDIAEMILSKYPLISEVKVTVKKPWAPLQMHFENVAVEITRKRHTVYLSIGSNMGDKKENLLTAVEKIKELKNTSVTKISTIIETEPFGVMEQDDFLNACLEVKTLLYPHELLEKLLHSSGTAYVLGGEGILGLEAACASLTEPGDRVLVLDNGIFGKGFADFVKMYGGEPVL
uniref:dihydroneopterin aldolase n=1 Tax=Fusobacterium ulcerans TaxID=861 RepID=UPI0026EBE30B